MRISWQYPISVMRLLIDKVIYLIQGKLHPDYEWIEVEIAEKMALRALSQSSAADMQSILQLYRRTGCERNNN
jgi:DNA ligase 1